MPALPSVALQGLSVRGRARLVLVLLSLIALAVIATFMTIGVKGGWAFVMTFRGTKVAAMILVGVAIATASVIFQTIVQNRILTPSIMGFDALYGLIQTVVVFALGARGLGSGEPRLAFAIDVAVMIGFALLLYGSVLSKGRHSLHMMLLVGVILGTLFRSITGFMERVIDPTDFVVLQDHLLANFNSIRSELLLPALVAIFVVLITIWRLLPRFDVALLGRDTAVALGVNHDRLVICAIILVAVLVSTSTALVGPVTFLGLLVANLAYVIVPNYRHVYTISAASLLAVITLVGGQLVLERVFALNAALPMIIEFVGGIVLIGLLAKASRR